MLMEAVKGGDVETASVLIQSGGRDLLCMADYEGNTALHHAFSLRDHVMSSFLISNGADEGIKNMYGLTCRQGCQISDYGQLNF